MTHPVHQDVTVWMRCPYDANLCGADATLAEFTTEDINLWSDGGWSGVLECANGHVFHLSQQALRQDPQAGT